MDLIKEEIDDEKFEWNFERLTEELLFVYKRPNGCPNCCEHYDGIAPIVWKEPKGKYVDVEKRNGEIDFVYKGGCKKPSVAPSWKCCICGQEFYSKKKYPSEGDSLFCIHIYRGAGPIGRPSSIRALYNTETEGLKVLYRYWKTEERIPITPEIKALFTLKNIPRFMTMRCDTNHFNIHNPYWITVLWKGRVRHNSISRHYIRTNPLLRQLIRVLFGDNY